MACQVGGQAEIWIEEERAILTAGQSMIVPAGHRHGFRNNGETTLHIEAVLAEPLVGPVTHGIDHRDRCRNPALSRRRSALIEPGGVRKLDDPAPNPSSVGRAAMALVGPTPEDSHPRRTRRSPRLANFTARPDLQRRP